MREISGGRTRGSRASRVRGCLPLVASPTWPGPEGVEEPSTGFLLVRGARRVSPAPRSVPGATCNTAKEGLPVWQMLIAHRAPGTALRTQGLWVCASPSSLPGRLGAQSVGRPTPAQVTISRFAGPSPASGSVLTARGPEPASDSVPPPLSLPLPRSCSVSLSLSQK